jgi:hypothetical protein
MIQEEGREFQNFAAEILELWKPAGGIILVCEDDAKNMATKQWRRHGSNEGAHNAGKT